MSDIERGFDPWHRLVHRLGKISPHRQVQLLCLISVVTVAVMVVAVLGSLDPTRASLKRSNDSLVPAIQRIDVARESYNQTLEVADAALLKAKATGRDRVVIGGTGSTTPDTATSATGAVLPGLSV